MNELKPCPFCGGMKISIWDKSRYDTCARCDTCNVQTDWLPTISDAIAAWNRRAGKDINVATNADRIRSMTDDKLAEIIYSFEDLKAPDYCQRKKECDDMLDSDIEIPAEKCIGCLIDWLRKPAKEEHHETD